MAVSRKQLEQQIVDFSRRLHAQGWVANHDGNVTARLGPSSYLATPTSLSKAAVRSELLIVVNAEGAVISGTGKPFGELALHLCVYRHRPDVAAVIHAHPPTATGFAVAGVQIRPTLLAEPVVSLGDKIPLVPYAAPKSATWTSGIIPYLDDADVLLLEHHGVLSFGPDLETAYLRLELCEHLAKIQLMAEQAGGARQIPSSDVTALLVARTKAGIGKASRKSAQNSPTPTQKSSSLIAATNVAEDGLRAIVRAELTGLLGRSEIKS